jgi:hypothetical protein
MFRQSKREEWSRKSSIRIAVPSSWSIRPSSTPRRHQGSGRRHPRLANTRIRSLGNSVVSPTMTLLA